MNYPHRRFLSFGLLIGLLGALPFTARAAEQSVPEEVKQAPASIDQAGKDAIARVVAAAMEDLCAADPTTQKRGRETLYRAAMLANGKAPSVVYQDEFTRQLNTALLARPLAKDAGAKARLNAGIALAGVVDRIPGGQLEPSVMALMDKNQPDAVAVWGVKAARTLIAASFERGLAPSSRLLDGVVAAVRNHPSGGVVQEAYGALIIDDPNVKPATLAKTVVPRLIDVFAYRVKLFAQGLPEDPDLDSEMPMLFLTKFSVWTSKEILTDKQRQDVAQTISDLVGLTAKHAASDREAAVRVLKIAGDRLVVLGKTVGSQELQTSAAVMKEMSEASKAEAITANAAEVVKGMKTAFKVTDPPPLAKGGN